MVDSYLLTLPESESAEYQIGTLGEKHFMSEKNGRQMLPVKLNNDYKFLNKALRDLIMVENYMFSISRNTMEHIYIMNN